MPALLPVPYVGPTRESHVHSHDAEDAFQATFLVLARKAGSVGRPDRLANWLYGIAYRMGEIDLDPASSETAQERVKAKEYHTAENNGLSHKWEGRVWLNPPYASGQVDDFVAKLCEHYQDGDVTSAILLTNNATDTKWFQLAASVASAICFPAGRIKFLREDGAHGSPLQGQAILYFGSSVKEFIERFGAFGITPRLGAGR